MYEKVDNRRELVPENRLHNRRLEEYSVPQLKNEVTYENIDFIDFRN